MPIRITEIDSRRQNAEFKEGTTEDQAYWLDADTVSASDKRIFKVVGTVYLKDAELLEKICREVFVQTGQPVVIDLSDICFLDSASAAVLCRMKREKRVEITGLNLFIKKVFELAEGTGFN